MTNDQLTPAVVRTLVPLLVGPLVTRVGLDIDDPDVLVIATAIVSFGWYVLVRLLELYKPALGVLLGVAKTPTYDKREKAAPFPPDEDVESVRVIEAVAVDRPVQTENGPKDEDGPQDYPFPEVEAFTGEMR